MVNAFEKAISWVRIRAVFDRLETISLAGVETMEAYGQKEMKRSVLVGVLQNVAVSAYQDGYAAACQSFQELNRVEEQ